MSHACNSMTIVCSNIVLAVPLPQVRVMLPLNVRIHLNAIIWQANLQKSRLQGYYIVQECGLDHSMLSHELELLQPRIIELTQMP